MKCDECHISGADSLAAPAGTVPPLPLPPGDRRSRTFQRLDETSLERLDDDRLVDYMRRARAAGDSSAGVALAVLVYGHWDKVERRVRMKVPEQYVEDLTAEIVADAVASAFDGASVGQFLSWLNTITQRAIADHYRRGAGRERVEALDDPDAVEPPAPGEDGEVAVRDAIERVLATLRPDHRRVVDIVVFEDRPARDAVAAVEGMSEDNVHQVVSRFRRALRRELDTGAR
jgi:RNA polymerase sigma factor (sigma-70 family)